MAVKIDKEMLIKHRFWILTGTSVLLILIAMLILGKSVSAKVASEKDKFEKKVKTLESTREVKNDLWVKAFGVQEKAIDGKKLVVWKEAWEAQAEIFTLPDEIAADFGRKYPNFGSPMDPLDTGRFADNYNKQVPEVYSIVEPLQPDGKGVVQFRGGLGMDGPNAVVALGHAWNTTTPPTHEDVWLAQEDLWVKRELLRVVRAANDAVARFQPVAITDKKPQKAGVEQRKFKNPYWELDLTLDINKRLLSGSITNISKRKQPLGITFKILLTAGDAPSAAPIKVDRIPLGVGETADIPPTTLPTTLSINGLFGVEQVLTWRTAPVKRIDRLEMGQAAHASRTVGRGLRGPKWIGAGAAPTTEGTPASNPQQAGQTMGNRTGQSGDTTKNGFIITRYTDTNEQVRHIPVGLVCVVDEDLLPFLLSAFANSKLRIQTTQCHWTRSHDRIKPAIEEVSHTPKPKQDSGPTNFPTVPRTSGTGPGKTAPMPGVAPPTMSGQGPLRMSGSPPAGPPPNMSGMGGLRSGLTPGIPGPNAGNRPQGATEEDEEEAPVVEAAVYGIASLYERFPTKNPADAGGVAANK